MAASMFVMNEKLDEIDKCPICHDPFKDPRSLPCVHTFCCECIGQCIEVAGKNPRDQMRCPMCRDDFIVPEGGGAGLPKNIFITQTVELKRLSSAVAEEMACDVCEQVAQLSQRDRAAGWVSNGQKWKTGTERQYLRTI